MVQRFPITTLVPPTVTPDRRLERVQHRFRQAERMAGIGTWRLTIEDNICEWSDHVFAIHGLEVGPHPGLDIALGFYPPESRATVSDAVARTISTGEPFLCETDLITARGDRRRVRAMGEIELLDGVPVAVIGVFQDISDHYAIQQGLRLAAATDDLTGLANRGAFERHLSESITASRLSGAALGLLLIDLDGFKAVNDAFGHPTGDTVLRDVAGELRRHCRTDCFAARIGGDEFAMIVGGVTASTQLDALVAALLVSLRRPIRRDGRKLEVSASIGIAWWTDDSDGSSDLIARADAALYDAKRQDRGSARIFGNRFISTGVAKRVPLKAVG
ncbi:MULTISPECIES: sensor domain-containing diguanylate cyclase [Sphingosinicellaceae]|uniref:sensor domain-containing diguanylate cyclase n=1 Tax=Sphingosinicellaceae TaxID=2820280 RepID=UPI001C1DF8CF|nr:MULTISPECIES: sensor domain-containing diguanylate cyclase [Polymorphobacter]QYE34081.1 GGDEF domain-containing protein [Polymorphobacter sp. PAMC 29334]UAJ09259.1 GGDEF domain-containing protein [Polymorphobacter megasporae]